jgi:hypothetical protein
MRGKIARLEQALDCSFLTEEHAAVLTMMLSLIDSYTAQIDELTARIQVLAGPYLHQIGQLDAVHGTGKISAQDVIAEIGVDMTVFPGRLPPGVLGQVVPAGRPVRRQTQRKQRLRPRQPLPVRRPRRDQHQRRPHPVLPGREIPAAGQANAQEESPRRDRRAGVRGGSPAPARARGRRAGVPRAWPGRAAGRL